MSPSLDMDLLTKTFTLSVQDTMRFIKDQNVDIIYLPEAPSILRDQYLEEFSSNKIMGKYFSPYGYNPAFNKPTILLAVSNDKWTLLHEFMHYLFERTRLERDKSSDADLEELHRNVREDFLEQHAALKRNLQASQQENVVTVFSRYVDLELKLSRRLYLEEMVIEKTISTFYLQGVIAGLETHQYKTALHYIESNARVVSGFLQTFFEIQDELDALFPDSSQLKATRRLLSRTQNELHETFE